MNLNLKLIEMKKSHLLLPVILLMFSCSQGIQNGEENVAVVEKYVQAVENLDYTTMESLLDDNYHGLGPSYTDSINKKQTLASWKYNVEN